jgi:hypothetical protein
MAGKELMPDELEDSVLSEIATLTAAQLVQNCLQKKSGVFPEKPPLPSTRLRQLSTIL